MRKLGRVSSHRNMMLRNQVRSLFINGKIVTTEARAKEVRRVAERMITVAKKNDVAARRQVLAKIGDKETVKNLFEEIAPKYEDRNGGYVRIIKLVPRQGDAAKQAVVELV